MNKNIVLMSIAAVVTLFWVTQAEARTRGCNAEYIVSMSHVSYSWAKGSRSAYEFRAGGGSCEWYDPNTCRRKARNTA